MSFSKSLHKAFSFFEDDASSSDDEEALPYCHGINSSFSSGYRYRPPSASQRYRPPSASQRGVMSDQRQRVQNQASSSTSFASGSGFGISSASANRINQQPAAQYIICFSQIQVSI